MAAQVVAAIALIAIAVQFAGAGFGIVALIVAIVVGPLASSVACVKANYSNRAMLVWVACALAIAGMVIARYSFYAVSLF